MKIKRRLKRTKKHQFLSLLRWVCIVLYKFCILFGDNMKTDVFSSNKGKLYRYIELKAVARFVSEGTKSSGTGAKPANHIQRISEVILEREAVFKKIIEQEGCAAVEFDHGDLRHLLYIYAC